MQSRLESLIVLIRSLDPAEKRFVQRQSGRHYARTSQPMQLFELLTRGDLPEPVGDMPEIRALGKALPTLVARLRSFVMDMVRMQHGGKTVESKVNLALEEVSILFHKKLWDDATWIIRKAQRNTRAYSLLPQFLQLLEWERKVVLAVMPPNSEKLIADIREREQAVEQLGRLQSELRHLDYQATDLVRKRLYLRDHGDRRRMEQLHAHQAIEKGLVSEDFLSYSHAARIRGTYFLAISNYTQAVEVMGELFERWQSSPQWIRESPNEFLAVFNRYQVALLNSEDKLSSLARLEKAIGFLGTLRFSSSAVALPFQKTIFQNSILIMMNTVRLQEAEALAPEIADWLDVHSAHISANTHLMFHYNIAVIYFMQMNFRAARNHVYSILDHPIREARSEIREFARLLQLVLNHELGDVELNEYHIPAAYQFFHRKGLSPLQKLTIGFLQELAKLPADAMHSAWIDYAQHLENIPEETGRMELLIWARARSAGIPLEESYRQTLAG